MYGIQPGTTLETLKEACKAGSAVEPLLRRVPVRRGDVCYIPAGCVHAIGAGIMLYEIQQSSDITYRFYDWDRAGKDGKKRTLHLEKALAVTDLDLALSPIPAPDLPLARVLDKEYFTLDILRPRENEPVPLPPICEFGMLTGLEGVLTLRWEGAEKKLMPGETLYLPTAAPQTTLTGNGSAALSMPR